MKIRKEIHYRQQFAQERGIYYYRLMKNSLDSGNIFTCKAALKYQQARRIYIHYTNEFQLKLNLPLSK